MTPKQLPIPLRLRSNDIRIRKVHFPFVFLFQFSPLLAVLRDDHAELIGVLDDGLVCFVVEVANVGGGAKEELAGGEHEGVEAFIVGVLSAGQERTGSCWRCGG